MKKTCTLLLSATLFLPAVVAAQELPSRHQHRVLDSGLQKDSVTPALRSIDTGHTIQKVRTARASKGNYIVASSYEGMMLGVSYAGDILWSNPLSGFMVHDIWCDDVTGDGTDEIVVANADGAVYCLDSAGTLLWKHHHNEVPMYAVTVVEKEATPYVVCGGFDLSIYYLHPSTGEVVKELPSATYSVQKPWGKGHIPPKFRHYANFLRPAQKPDGTPILVMHGNDNSMQTRGYLYFFDILADKPFRSVEIEKIEGQISSPIGDVRIIDSEKDRRLEIVLGLSCHQGNAAFAKYELDLQDANNDRPPAPRTFRLGFGYVVCQTELINDAGTEKYLTRVGNSLILTDTDLSTSGEEYLRAKYSFYDLWKDGHRIILASAQSGGSCIHVIDTRNPDWKEAYKDIDPPGKLQRLISHVDTVRRQTAEYRRPEWEREPRKVYLMTESTDRGLARDVADDIRAKYDSPVFLGGSWMSHAENWDRSGMANEKYRNRRDRRRKYDWTQEQCVEYITPWYQGEPGIAYWGGHGNDPYMMQLSTTKKVLDFAAGKKTVLIFPELEDHSEDMAWVMKDLFYPLADYARSRNGNIYVRTKHNFWQGNIYLPMWEEVLDGRYADVFIPSMEETTDKAMDISVAGRAGLWASGVFDDWGTRTVPDNPSFDRSRQFSHQRVPNHFLRHMMYHMAHGATYINNFTVDADYMSVIWDLIAKGALYVPHPNEVVSYSPVHLGMKEPDDHYMNEGSSLKWATFYSREFEESNPFVFSRQSSTYMAGRNAVWDFSTYASGAKDRRQNFLPPYPHGLVLITPPQEGVFAKKDVPRGTLKDHLHPIYRDILREFITDGRHYYSADGTQTYAADTYAQTVANEIENRSRFLPIRISGDVAWMVAQTAPCHLRLTIIDGGYLNPSDKTATVIVQTADVMRMTDILDNTVFDVSHPANIRVDIPCGGFRFIDVELKRPLVPREYDDGEKTHEENSKEEDGNHPGVLRYPPSPVSAAAKSDLSRG